MRILALCVLLTGCQHYCENYVDCDARAKLLQEQVVALREENRRLRMTAMDMAYEKCDIR